MKKYSKPIVKACTIRMSSIIANSPTLKDSGTDADQLGKERGGFFDDEEGLSW